MVAGRTPWCNYDTNPPKTLQRNPVDSGTPLLALRLGDSSYALDPGRDYVLGSAEVCDLRIAGAEPFHARLSIAPILAAEGAGSATVCDLDSKSGLLHNEERKLEAPLQPGDRLAIGDEILVIAADDGSAALVPIPALRQAAVARRIERVRDAAAALRKKGGDTFAQQMAHELRRAPWMMISLVLHLLLLLLLWIFVPVEQIGGAGLATTRFESQASAPAGNGVPDAPKVVSEPEDDLELEDPSALADATPVPDTTGPLPATSELKENPQLAKRKRPRSLGGGTDVARIAGAIGSGSFREQVAELQESGLEIMFVFDSTGSMTRTITDTKTTIVQMLDVLRTLVPDARVGLATYRDRNRREDYLVRQVPLDLDYWRASNFVQFVTAEGGGDRPEDVRAGLNAAFSQNWREAARRVVVLAGDAPAHSDDFGRLLKEVRTFAANRRSFVHTLITSPERAGDDTRKQFERIADAGRGSCEPIEHRDRVLQRVLTLAFGKEFDQDIEAVAASIERERGRVDVGSLHLARKGGSELRRALLRRPVPARLWNALVKRPHQATTDVLFDLLVGPRTPSHTRHAAAAALQHILELPVPPIETETNEPPSPRRIQRLRTLAKRLPK